MFEGIVAALRQKTNSQNLNENGLFASNRGKNGVNDPGTRKPCPWAWRGVRAMRLSGPLAAH